MTTNRHSIYSILLIMLLTSMFLFACSSSTPIPSPSPDQTDKTFLTGIPCAAPCWHGLVIGRSTKSDVMSTLPNLTFIDQSTIYIHQMQSMPGLDPRIWAQGIEITADCISPKMQCLTIRVVDNILTEVVVSLNYRIELDEVIEYLGNPDYVGYRNLSGEKIICEINVLWKSKQLALTSKQLHGIDAKDTCDAMQSTGKIASSLIISEVRYTSVDAIEVLLSSASGEFFNFSGTSP